MRSTPRLQPTFPARGTDFRVPCPECQEDGSLASVPDVVSVYREKGKRKKTTGNPLRVLRASRGSVRDCKTCKGRGSVPRKSPLDPYELP